MIQTKTLDELKEELTESIESTTRILSAILEDVKTGIYGPEQAAMDYENLMFNESVNFMSIIQEISELSI